MTVQDLASRAPINQDLMIQKVGEHLLSTQGLICIMGPTAAGKTALAMQLYEHFPCELISVDSALIYRGMDIGTAKPTSTELRQYPHHLIDILDPAESYSAADFVQDAELLIEQALQQSKIPILVGGTMLYYKALFEGMAPLPPADEGIRQALTAQAEQQGWQALHQELQACDPHSAARIHPHDPQRLTRALEIYRLTGKNMTAWLQEHQQGIQRPAWHIAVAPQEDNRAWLHQRIEMRFDQMLEQDFEQEVKQLMARGDLHLELPSMRCVGYRQMWQYLAGDISAVQMREQGLAATRQLAKRQLTWLRSWPALQWIAAELPQQDIFTACLQCLTHTPESPQLWNKETKGNKKLK